MARFKYFLSVNKTATGALNPPPANGTRSVGFTVSTASGNINGTPQARIYIFGDTPGAFQNIPLVSSSYIISFDNLSNGRYVLEYNDSSGTKEIGKINLVEPSVSGFDHLVTSPYYQEFGLNVSLGVTDSSPSNRMFMQCSMYYSVSPPFTNPVSTAVSGSIDGSTFKPMGNAISGGIVIYSDSEINAAQTAGRVDVFTNRSFNGIVYNVLEDLLVTDAPLAVTYTKVDEQSFEAEDGSITLIPSGGSGTRTYLWGDGPTTQNRTALAPGTYTVTVTDTVTSETVLLSITINAFTYATFSIGVVKTDVTVTGGSDGTITVTPSGGSGNVGYVWGDGPTTQNRTGLAADIYTVTATDAVTGEVQTVSIQVNDPAPIPSSGTTLQVPMLNPIQFVIEDESGIQTLDNTLLCDQYFGPRFKKTNYFQPIVKGEQLQLQFNSDFEEFNIFLYEYGQDEVIKEFTYSLVEQNVNFAEDFAITIKNHAGNPGQSRVYFTAGTLQIPLNIGESFEVLNNADGFDNTYTIINILTDTSSGNQYMVINLDYTAGTPTSAATGRFTTSTEDFNVFESVLSFLDVANGKYYMTIEAISNDLPIITAVSEPMDIQVEHKNTLLLEYTNKDNDLDITWTTGFQGRIRVPGIFGHQRLPGGEISTSRDSNFDLVTTSGKVTRGVMLQTFGLPPYMHEKVSVIMKLDFKLINKMQVNSLEGYGDPQYIEEYLLANSSIKVEVKGWFRGYNSNDLGTITEGGFILSDNGFIKR